jgi:hypothetical protein
MLTVVHLTTGQVISHPKFTIRVPPHKAGVHIVTSNEDDSVNSKRKHFTDTESETKEMPKATKDCKRAKQLLISDDELQLPQKLSKKQGHPCKPKTESDDELPVIAKRPRGRPRKDKENRPPKGFDVSAVVEVARPPLHVRGKTIKGHKWVKQEPMRLGPFRFNERTGWTNFLQQVHKTAYISEDQMVLNGMTWRMNKSANSALPLTDSGGYWTMMQQILSLRDSLSVILIIGHPIPNEDVPDKEVPVSGFTLARPICTNHEYLKPWAQKGGSVKPGESGDDDKYADELMTAPSVTLPVVDRTPGLKIVHITRATRTGR